MENTTPLQPPEPKSALEQYSSLIAEARKRLIFTLIIFVLATFSGFIFYEQIIRFILEILSLKGINIVFTSPFQFINLAISSGVACGVIVAFPFLIVQILSFLKPALKNKEFRMVINLIPLSFVLFLTGLAFGFFIMKWQIAIFLERSLGLGIGNILDISKLLTTVLITSALMGLGFQFPVLLVLLLRLGIVKRQTLNKTRKWIYLGSVVFAILLPADSILADIILALPLIILYELTLIFSRNKKEVLKG